MENKSKEEEQCAPGTPISPYAPDIVWDLDGYLVNAKYPPNIEKYGYTFNGYPNGNYETFFFDFAVHRYDLRFSYKGKNYYALSEKDYVALCDDHFTEEYEQFPHANAFIENFKIDGRPLIDLIDELEDVERV